MPGKLNTLFTSLSFILKVVSTDLRPDETSNCANVQVPAGLRSISESNQDAWKFMAAPGHFKYVLYRNFHGDPSNEGVYRCTMLQKVLYENKETKKMEVANFTKWFDVSLNKSFYIQSYYKMAQLNGTSVKNVLSARHRRYGSVTREYCYPFVYTDGNCAVVLMSHWDHAAAKQCKNVPCVQMSHPLGGTAQKEEKRPCETACEMWVRAENLDKASVSEDCTSYYERFCGEAKFPLYNKTICDLVEEADVTVTSDDGCHRDEL
uniref:Putative lipocalin n=2 Tax=Ixodes ricinus TaxID=34613 RepID=V5GZD0_IXORI